MRRFLLFFFFIFFLSVSLFAREEEPKDTVTLKKKSPTFLAINTAAGLVLPTNDYIREGKNMPFSSSLTLKYGIYSRGDTWQDVAYGMPYFGVGLYSARFFNKKALGYPFSLFLFQGAEIKRISHRTSLYYELDLGMSFNWKPYDVFDNPDNIALGSSANVHVGAVIYFRTPLSDRWDIHYGLNLSHFSNGAQQLPNKGINIASPFIELVYNFNGNPTTAAHTDLPVAPLLEERFDYDLTFTSSTRQIRVDTVGTGLPSRLLDKNFRVLGLSASAMRTKGYKYRWGPSLELVYDESSGVKAWRERHPEDGEFYDRVKLGDFHQRFSLGLSVKGEITYPHHTFFAHIGYNLIHGNDYDYRLYQIIGLKAYLKDNLFGTFGIRAARFSKAQYLYWSIGYTIPGRPLKKKAKN
ncbi:acyloxyacyl hydrolase [Parabacteroides sp. PF5-6]|uniref:acyloxyacyl hydrolase n=1 Tax=Parabacteroides sp. PF5-6 TaxID=1742403 RepID=UPI00240749E5|nr:acyloxyacyl hydrolase [Parabacteroides sp. PF5-6]